MARYAFKPDSSFFRKIAMGAVGTRAVARHLDSLGHRMVELERGSTDTRLWKEVKRKRVRVPDLVCLRCGVRVECRAKDKPKLSMSHGLSEDTRAWDFGMIDEDWVAFPVCAPNTEDYWHRGRLLGQSSYWHERNYVGWNVDGHINYFPVEAFRRAPHVRTATKGATEGSETTITWAATFATKPSTVEQVSGQRLTIRGSQGGRRHTRTVDSGQTIHVSTGVRVNPNQVLASSVIPVLPRDLQCPRSLTQDQIERLLLSRERTQRFTGTKLARHLQMSDLADSIQGILLDPEEDVYVRLEAACYLAAVNGLSVRSLFGPFYAGQNEQTQLEAVIATGEAGTPDAVEVLCEFLDSPDYAYFLRSAAAWSLSQIGSEDCERRLIGAFCDFDPAIREEALEGIVNLGASAFPRLLEGLTREDNDIAAGCAEALRQQCAMTGDLLDRVMTGLDVDAPSLWTVWLLGNLPRDFVSARIAEYQERSPRLHYALSVLWSFIESWIARRWELSPCPGGDRNDL